MDNKTVIEFGFHRMLRIMQISENAIVLLLFSSVQVLFFDLNTIQLHELTTFNQSIKGGFYMHVVFNSTYKVSQSLYKKFVFLLVKRI